MFNLILKDWKVPSRVLLGIFAWWAFFLYSSRGFFSKRGSVFPFIIVSLMLVLQSLIIDDKAKTESLFVSLPVKRSTIVSARYLSAFLMIVTVLFVTYFTSFFLNLIMPELFKTTLPFKNLFVSQIIVIYFIVLVFPLFFKYGAHLDAGMKVITIAMVIVILIIMTAIITASYYEVDILEIKLMLLYSCLLALLLSAGSWLWSQRIFRMREF